MSADSKASTPPRESGASDWLRRRGGATALAVRLAASSTDADGAKRCLLNDSVATAFTRSTGSETSSDPFVLEKLQEQLHSLVRIANDQVIEDGMSNEINEHLAELVAGQGYAIVAVFAALFEAQKTRAIVTAEILKELGRVRDRESHDARLWLLEYALRSPWPVARDGAGLGLARLADPDAKEYLQRAIEREQIAEIRDGLQLVLEELDQTVVSDGATAAEID